MDDNEVLESEQGIDGYNVSQSVSCMATGVAGYYYFCGRRVLV